VPTEREAIRNFVRGGGPLVERLSRAVDEGQLRIAGDAVAETDEELVVVASNNCGIIGAKPANCGCGTEVWLSPSTLEMMAKRGNRPTKIMCLPCVLKEKKNGL
jgi:hypothetical protein